MIEDHHNPLNQSKGQQWYEKEKLLVILRERGWPQIMNGVPNRVCWRALDVLARAN